MEKGVGDERRLALTIDIVPQMDSRIVPERASTDRTALHHIAIHYSGYRRALDRTGRTEDTADRVDGS